MTATLPPISTSVARLMPSTSECRQPYLLSNFDLVTESFTLMAGKRSEPSLAISYSRCTPVVVSSVTPLISVAIALHLPGASATEFVSTDRMTRHSSASSSLAAGTVPADSNSAPLWTSSVASPPSSSSMFGPTSPGQVRACCVHHQYSPSVSPFQANTGMPLGSSGVPSGPTATAAAAWSWVEKMLQDAHRTRAPSATRVSISTAVCTVMCSDPVIRAPASGCESAHSARTAIRPGISCSASLISRRPKSASDKSATLNGMVSAGMRAPVSLGVLGYVRQHGHLAPIRSQPRRYALGPTHGTVGALFLTATCKISLMRITEAARRLDLTPRMLRYRESLGLLPALRPAGGRGAARRPAGAPERAGTGRASTGRAGAHRQFTDTDLAAVALGLSLERRYDISPVALAFGIRVLADPRVRAEVAELGRRIGRVQPPPARALDFEQERALRLLGQP